MTSFLRRPAQPWLVITWLSLAAGFGASPAAAQMVSGSYTGNGTAGRKITGLGFKPDVVLIKGNDQDLTTPVNTATVLRSSSMVGDNSKPMITDTSSLVANQFQSLDVDGFTVGSDRRVNKNATTFYWTAWKADADLKVGSYTGNGATQSITGFGMSPDYVIVMATTGRRAIQATTATGAAGRSFEFNSNVWFPNNITSLDAGGFSVAHNATYPYANENGVVYHYVAWNAVPLKTFVGAYNGNAIDNRNITGIGFQPEYLIIKAIYNNDAAYGPTFTPPAAQRYAAMVGDTVYNFTAGPAANEIQALLTDGFQVGNSTSLNRQYVDCDEDGGFGCAYFYVAFNAVAPDTPLLGATESGGNITVTAANSFEMTFDTSFGGGIQKFYDLAEDPNRTSDLGGGLASAAGVAVKTLFHVGLQSGGTWYTPGDNTADTADTYGRWSGSPPKLDLLEATPVRMRVRQEAFYSKLCDTQPGCSAGTLAGIKGVGDYSVYPSGKLAIHWRQNITANVPFTNRDLALGVYSECPSCPNLTAYSSSASIASGGSNPAADTFLLAKRELAGRRTDFLSIMYGTWGLADQTGFDQSVAFLDWRDFSPVVSPLTTSEAWNFLDYFKPTNFTSNVDTAATGRSADYRGPDPLSVMTGGPWIDGAENTAVGDDFNEAEGAYSLTLDTANGLAFDMDGSVATPRVHPFFKIRQWRSVGGPGTISLESVTQTKDVNFRAAVKPVSRASLMVSLKWHSTLESAAAVTGPDVGNAGTSAGATYVAARYGNGVLVDQDTDVVTFPSASLLASAGAVEFWYQPNYQCQPAPGTCDGVRHVFWSDQFDLQHFFTFEKDAGNALVFQIRNGPGGANLHSRTVSLPNFGWRASDWVHLRAEWNDSAPLAANRLRIFVNGIEPAHTDSGNYSGTTLGTSSWIGTLTGNSFNASGIIDEFHVYSGASPIIPLADGGLTTNANEYLADTAKNFNLLLQGVSGSRSGVYLYIGSDSHFLGLNVVLATNGVGPLPGDLDWEYWDGTQWANLESVGTFIDTTNSFTKNGNVAWQNPGSWPAYSVNGGPDLYYVRVHLKAGAVYSTAPGESLITTDILLLQYMGDVTTAAQTFAIAAPVPTAVTLQSFEARGTASGIDLAWTTATEIDNLGFHLYRALSADGPWERITSSVIPGLGGSVVGRSYSYGDSSVTGGVTYFYRLEDIDTSGHTESHGPVSATAGVSGSGATGPPGGGGVPPSPDPSGGTYGDPSSVVLREVERSARHVVLELLTGGFTATPEDGGFRLHVAGFESTSKPGEPSLPMRRALVEAVAGKRVRLVSVAASDQLRFPGLRPVPESIPAIDVDDDGSVMAGEKRSREGRAFLGPFPAEGARLVGTSFQGERKKAELLLFPIRWDGSGLVLSRRLLVRLEFGGAEAGETTLGGSRGRRQTARSSHVRRGVVAQITVHDRGLYRVDYEDVFPPGGREPRGLAPSSLRLSRQGEAVAYHLSRSVFGPGSSLYFLSEGASLNPYADAVYELETDQSGLVMEERTLSPFPFATLSVGDYLETVRREENYYFQSGLLEAPDPWLWDIAISPGNSNTTFTTSQLSRYRTVGRLHVVLQGGSDAPGVADHHVRVKVNGVVVGETTFDGAREEVLDLAVPGGIFLDGTNTLTLENVGDTGAGTSMVFLNWYAVSYPRALVALQGKLEGRFPRAGPAEIQGASPASIVLDTTGTPQWISGATASPNGMTLPVEAARSYLVTTSVLRPTVKRLTPSLLKSPANQADYLLLAPQAFLSAAQPLLDFRENEGLVTKAVSLEEVYEQFGHGEVSPQAIKEFLEYAYHSWSAPSIHYVLLLGDASYDPKDYLGTGTKDWLPGYPVVTSYIQTVSDPAYASVNGNDSLPDIALGRLPAASVGEAQGLVQKILNYENGGGTLAGAAVLVADNRDLAGDFEADADDVAATVLASRNPQKIYYSLEGANTRTKIRQAFDDGVSLMNYIGHGSTVAWASENFFNYQDVPALALQPQQPLLLTMNCLNGFFHFPPLNSLSEALLKPRDKGVIAAFSPTGLSVNDPAHIFHKAVLQEVVSGNHARLGDAVLAAQEAYAQTGAFPELLSIYHLFGDPALRIR